MSPTSPIPTRLRLGSPVHRHVIIMLPCQTLRRKDTGRPSIPPVRLWCNSHAALAFTAAVPQITRFRSNLNPPTKPDTRQHHRSGATNSTNTAPLLLAITTSAPLPTITTTTNAPRTPRETEQRLGTTTTEGTPKRQGRSDRCAIPADTTRRYGWMAGSGSAMLAIATGGGGMPGGWMVSRGCGLVGRVDCGGCIVESCWLVAVFWGGGGFRYSCL